MYLKDDSSNFFFTYTLATENNIPSAPHIKLNKSLVKYLGRKEAWTTTTSCTNVFYRYDKKSQKKVKVIQIHWYWLKV